MTRKELNEEISEDWGSLLTETDLLNINIGIDVARDSIELDADESTEMLIALACERVERSNKCFNEYNAHAIVMYALINKG